MRSNSCAKSRKDALYLGAVYRHILRQRSYRCNLHTLVDTLETSSDYWARRQHIRDYNAASPVIKKGLALTPVKFGISFTAQHLNQAGALLHVYTDGSIMINHGGTEMGQGLHTKICQVVARELGLDLDSVRISATDWVEGGWTVEETVAFAKEHKRVETLFGRQIHTPEIGAKGPHAGFAKRAAINAPIQGTAADIIRRAMIRMPEAIAGLPARMLLQVHDELLFEVDAAAAEELISVARAVMEGAADPVVKLDVPLVADAGQGANWAEAH